ncbi:BMP family ABC transporter substrate-binding protein [Psychrilyobacter sp.]|uniref:BMP family lipoprotein n=1 Tax=Psychrilyobacter sp. TaxID=2586924 RepID=UPI003017B91F
MKRIILFLMGLSLILLTACGKEENTKNAENEGVKKVDYKVGIVLGLGGLGDKSFNDSAYKGLLKAEKELGVKIKYVEPTTLSEFDQFFTEFAEANYDLIIGVSFDAEKGIEKAAKEYPESTFVIIDSVVDLPNVKSIIFNQKEGSFLAGAIGEMVSKNKSLGFIGAIEIPIIKSFYEGYEQGAQYMNPNIEVRDIYVGGGNSFNDPARAKELAISMAENGIDVIFTVAGGSGRGVMEAIKGREGLYGIGIDSNQDGEVEGKILTSILKRVDVSIFDATFEGLAGKFTAGTVVLGLKENGIGTTNFEFSKEIIGEENLAELEQIKKDLISGKIKIK